MIVIKTSVRTEYVNVDPVRIETSPTGVEVLVSTLVDVHTAGVGVSGETHLAALYILPHS